MVDVQPAHLKACICVGTQGIAFCTDPKYSKGCYGARHRVRTHLYASCMQIHISARTASKCIGHYTADNLNLQLHQTHQCSRPPDKTDTMLTKMYSLHKLAIVPVGLNTAIKSQDLAHYCTSFRNEIDYFTQLCHTYTNSLDATQSTINDSTVSGWS